jgi:hypothetical protein
MLFVLYSKVMFNLYPTDAPSVEVMQPAPQLINCVEEIQFPVELNQQGNTRIAAACVAAVAIGAVIAWKSPLGKKVRTKIASAIAPVASV